jgi:hypothetical protein
MATMGLTRNTAVAVAVVLALAVAVAVAGAVAVIALSGERALFRARGCGYG